MNGRTAKLLRRAAVVLGREPRAMKRLYKALANKAERQAYRNSLKRLIHP